MQVVLNKINFFGKIKQVLEEYTAFRNKVISQIERETGDYYGMCLEDPTFEQKINAASADVVIAKVESALKKLEELKIRFERETVNISVIGRAGQGKSRLLQSISGVNNAIIPADSGGDCTGAKSVICNSETPLHAVIHCYSEKELIEQVQKYLDALNYGHTLGSVAQIPNIDTAKIGGQKMTNKQDSYYRRLLAYVEHYKDYSSLIGNDLSVNSADEIRQYVAQYLPGKPPVKVYLFLAVKEVQIFTPFNFPDAGKIMLVDTIGLGDTSIGLREKMIDTLINDSDAAILLRRPDNERDGIREEDNELYDLINDRMKGRDMEKWLFYVLNIYGSNEGPGENLYEELMLKFGKTIKAAFIEKIDCADTKAVEDKLIIPMLSNLSMNLTEVDNSLMHIANDFLSECFDDFFELSGKVQLLADSSFKKDLNTGGLFDMLYEDELGLARKLEELNLRYRDHTQKCKDIEDDVKKSISHIISTCPTYDNILDNLKSGRADSHPSIVYENMSDYYRASISDKFDEINRGTIVELQEGLKNSIIDVLRCEEGGKLDVVPLNCEEESSDNLIWLETFISQKLSDYPLVRRAFEEILNYRLNIEGMLEYYVNVSLECMNPEEKKKFAKIDFSKAESKEKEADLIEQALLSASSTVANTLISLIQDLLQIPYSSFYARIRKLREKIIYSKEGERELKNMYREFATYIWRDRFASVATKQVAMQELNSIIDSLAEYRVKNLFTLKIEKV